MELMDLILGLGWLLLSRGCVDTCEEERGTEFVRLQMV